MTRDKQASIKSAKHQMATFMLGWPTLLAGKQGIESLNMDTTKQSGLDDDLQTMQVEDVAQQQAFDHLEAKIDVDSALSHLTDIELDVIKYHYGLMDGGQWSFPKIGDYFGFSATKARVINTQAIKKLRKFFNQL